MAVWEAELHSVAEGLPLALGLPRPLPLPLTVVLTVVQGETLSVGEVQAEALGDTPPLAERDTLGEVVPVRAPLALPPGRLAEAHWLTLAVGDAQWLPTKEALGGAEAQALAVVVCEGLARLLAEAHSVAAPV